ncbi:hypothetical protein [Rhodopseudomonas parapalustris]
MVSNDLISGVAITAAMSQEGPSILDQPLRDILMRAAGPHPEHLRFQLGRPVAIAGSDSPFANVFVTGRDPYDVDLIFALERERSDVASVARFGHRVTCASYHFYMAFEKARITDFEPAPVRNMLKTGSGLSVWYSSLVNTTFNRYRDLKRALLHKWSPPAEVEPLTSSAFRMLCEITPADSQLRSLFIHDQARAFHELAHHLDIVADQLKAAIKLATDLEMLPPEDLPSDDAVRLAAAQAKVLNKAGKALKLTEAAARVGTTRQALHKRIRNGSALGLMRGSELIVPSAQLIDIEGKAKIVDGLSPIVALFDSSGAGRWSALQFLTQVDPNLREAPLDALKQGKDDAVVDAARAYLGLDEA